MKWLDAILALLITAVISILVAGLFTILPGQSWIAMLTMMGMAILLNSLQRS